MGAPKLTDKQALFVKEYLVDLNATQAAIRAGYSSKTANVIGPENLAKPCIAEAVAEAFQKRIDEVEIDASYVLRQAVKLHERCMQEIEPYTDRKGAQITDEKGNPLFVFDAGGSAKALDLIGKHVNVKAFMSKMELTGKDGAPLMSNNLDEMPDEELIAIVEGRKPKT
jgi:phage terminase small subunit